MYARSGGSAATPLPDRLAVTGISFTGDSRQLSFRFAPGVVGEGLTDEVTFTEYDGERQSVSAQCAGGLCSGSAVLTARGQYSVTLVVGNGEESRSALLASDLTWDGSGGVRWTPAE